jgi:PRC-barrel domain
VEDLGHPISYLTLKRGAAVYSSDGQRLGKVVKVYAAPEAHLFDGVVIDTKAGPGGRRFVDAPEIGEIYERGIVLKIDAAEAAALPTPRAAGR